MDGRQTAKHKQYKMKKILLVLIAVSVGMGVMAQQELGTHLMRGVWQANKTNPALLPEARFVIGLPGVYNGLSIENITYSDLVTPDDNGGYILNIDNVIARLDDRNRIREHLEVETFSIGMRFGKVLISAGHSVQFNAFINYPKTLPQLIWQGNSQFLGQRVDFSTDLQLFGYNTFFAGAALPLTQNITIGARAKWLNGFGDISTDRTRLGLFTDEEAYQLTLDADFRLNSTGSIQYDGLRNLAVNYEFGSFSTQDLLTRNQGLAFDLGLQWQLDKLDIAASVLDLGGIIRWKDGVQNYSLNGVYEFTGLDVAPAIVNKEGEVGNAIDTLLNLYDFVETNNAYTSRLPLRYYLSGTYQLNDTWRLGGMIYSETWRGETFPAAAVGANVQLFDWLNAGATYAFRNEHFNNLGVNTTMQFGPLQIITMTDNLLSALRPKDSNSANVRVGLNLLFR